MGAVRRRRGGMDPPEGFVPYELRTSFGTLTLPDAKCVMCIAQWRFFSCTMCCLTQTLEQDAKTIMDKMIEELNG